MSRMLSPKLIFLAVSVLALFCFAVAQVRFRRLTPKLPAEWVLRNRSDGQIYPDARPLARSTSAGPPDEQAQASRWKRAEASSPRRMRSRRAIYAD